MENPSSKDVYLSPQLRLWRWLQEFFAPLPPRVVLRGNDIRLTYVMNLPHRPVVDYVLTPCVVSYHRRHQFWPSFRDPAFRLKISPHVPEEAGPLAGMVRVIHAADYANARNEAHQLFQIYDRPANARTVQGTLLA